MYEDLRSAVRLLLRQRGLCTVAILTLAIGVSVNTTILALVRSIVAAPHAYRASENVFKLLPADHMAQWPFELSDLYGIAALPGVDYVAGCASASLISNRTYPSPLVSATEVSKDFFRVLGVKPERGRILEAADFSSGMSNAVISHDLAEVLRNRSPEVLGQQIKLNRRSYAVVGVMPPAFAPPCFESAGVRRQAWIPLESSAGAGTVAAGLSIIVRTRAEHSIDYVQSRIDEYGDRRAAETARAPYVGMFLERLGLEEERRARPGLLLLQCLAALLLLIACANLGSLLLLDASRRDTEFLTRAFLGASPWRIGRQLLTESTLVATVSGALGVILSLTLEAQVRGLVAPIVSRGMTYQIQWMDSALCVLAAIVISIVFAGSSAVVAARRARRAAGRSEVQGTASVSMRRLQDGLVAIQVALSTVLAIATGVVGLSYVSVAAIDPGLDASGVTTSVVYMPPEASAASQAVQVQQTLADRLHQADASRRVSFSDTPPFAGGSNWRISIDGGELVASSVSANVRSVSPNYFDVLRIPIKSGRAPHSGVVGLVGEAVASESFAEALGLDKRLIGRVVRAGGTSEQQSAFTRRFGLNSYRIVGIAQDVRTTWIWAEARPTIYVDLGLADTTTLAVQVRSDNMGATTADLERIIQQTAPDSPEIVAESLGAILWRSEAERGFYAWVAALFALIAITVAVAGTFTAVRRMVALRTKEFAIRTALGASPHRLHLLVLRSGLFPVTLGLAAGLLGALWLVEITASRQYVSPVVNIIIRTAPNLVSTAVGVAVAALLLSALACWLPARRVSTVSPASLMKGAE